MEIQIAYFDFWRNICCNISSNENISQTSQGMVLAIQDGGEH